MAADGTHSAFNHHGQALIGSAPSTLNNGRCQRVAGPLRTERPRDLHQQTRWRCCPMSDLRPYPHGYPDGRREGCCRWATVTRGLPAPDSSPARQPGKTCRRWRVPDVTGTFIIAALTANALPCRRRVPARQTGAGQGNDERNAGCGPLEISRSGCWNRAPGRHQVVPRGTALSTEYKSPIKAIITEWLVHPLHPNRLSNIWLSGRKHLDRIT